MKFTLTRFCYSEPMGTFGTLKADDGSFECVTIEQPWRDNRVGHSCIPEGHYVCRRGHFPRHGETFEVTNVPGRTAILIHPGNVASNFEGCIGPGDKLGVVWGEWAVLNSQATWRKLMDRLAGIDEFELEITQYHPGG